MLGYPASDELPLKDGVYQTYQGGVIYWTPPLAGHTMASDYQAKFDASGGLATLGFPASDKVVGLKEGGSSRTLRTVP